MEDYNYILECNTGIVGGCNNVFIRKQGLDWEGLSEAFCYPHIFNESR